MLFYSTEREPSWAFMIRLSMIYFKKNCAHLKQDISQLFKLSRSKPLSCFSFSCNVPSSDADLPASTKQLQQNCCRALTTKQKRTTKQIIILIYSASCRDNRVNIGQKGIADKTNQTPAAMILTTCTEMLSKRRLFLHHVPCGLLKSLAKRKRKQFIQWLRERERENCSFTKTIYLNCHISRRSATELEGMLSGIK